ncbi:MAG: Tim44/TimA family putative adaptor protein [Litorimonas sp.]
MIYEVIIWAALATVTCVIMYSVLGKQVGKGSDDALDLDKIFKPKSPQTPNGSNVVPMVQKTKTIFSPIQAIDNGFTESHFISGAKAAYSMILEAFANGDKDLLKSLLTNDVYMVYEDAINARESKNYRQVTDLGRLKSVKVQDVKMDGAIARIHVVYEAELTSALLNEEGDVVEGDPDVLSSISEVWEYERNLKSSSQNWLLADVVPSEGDELEADPTPDTKSVKKPKRKPDNK